MTPTADEMARNVTRLIVATEANDVQAIAEQLDHATRDAPTAGMTILSLAYISSRDLAALAASERAELSVGGVYGTHGPLDVVDPRHMAMLLAVATANADTAQGQDKDARREALLHQVDLVLAKGRDYTRTVIAVLLGMAAAQTQRDGNESHQHPEQN